MKRMRESATTVLLVEDNAADATYIEELFRDLRATTVGRVDGGLDLEHVETLAACRRHLDEDGADVVLLDLQLPGSTGLETLDTVLEATTDEPIVVLTGLDDEGVGVEAVERGAQDYLVKSDVNATLLGRTIRYAIERQQRERQLRDRNEELMLLNRLVSHDIRDDMALVRGWGRPLYDNVDPDGRANLDRLLGATNHVIELTDTVADFLEVLHDRESMSLRPIELTATLDSEIEKVRARHEQVTIERVGAEGTVYVQATELLSSVFRNLLVNAVQHNDTDEPAVQVDVMADPDTVTVTFADDGPGVRDGQKDAVFGRTEAGLADPECSVGLYLVGTLLEMYDGEVTVTDNDPRGSVFEVTLQRADPAEV
jgi:signal transduction histidine kinase